MNINDPRIVLYIHNEMGDDERTAFEKEMTKNQELKQAVEEINLFSGLLEEGFSAEPVEELTDDSREKILGEIKKTTKTKKHGLLFFLTRAIIPIAACYMVVMHWHNPAEDYSKSETISINEPVTNSAPAVYEFSEDTELHYDMAVECMETAQPEVEDLLGQRHSQKKASDVVWEKSLFSPKREEKVVAEKSCSKALMMRYDGNYELETIGAGRYSKPICKEKLVMNSMYGARASKKESRRLKCGERPLPSGYIAHETFGQDDIILNTEAYDKVDEQKYIRVTDEALSTFSIDVDTASYSNVRRMLSSGQLPPKGAVRIEEMINYFNYDYKAPQDDKPFSVDLEMAKCPWATKHRLVRIGLKGKEISSEKREAANLVFLLDVSGSMNSHNKLPLLKKSLKMLVNNLKSKDRVAIVVYAGASGLVLPSTSCENRQQIIEALDRLSAGGSTNGGAGIDLAYKTAVGNFIENGINRVILCTDGDFNVGTTNQSELIEKIEKSAKTGVFLSVFGFGMRNYKDSTLEKLADKGNGNYGYIDTEKEAKKALVDQVNGTLVTIAKDVKIQVEFNPAQVQAYRLIGYENRKLNKQDFNDDKKDAGEIGAGHTVTALYEVVLAGDEVDSSSVDPLKYQAKAKAESGLASEVLTAKVRYKNPDEDKSKLLTFPLKGQISETDEGSDNLRFAAGVSAFGMLLRDSQFKGEASYEMVLELCGKQDREIRKEFIELVNKAKRLTILK